MSIIELRYLKGVSHDEKAINRYSQFEKLLETLKERELPEEIIGYINQRVEEVNSSLLSERDSVKLIKRKQTEILKKIEKELKLVPKKYYQTLWMVAGFTVFGLPIGVAFGLIIGNIGLLAVGLPIGMAIGFMVGSAMDKKASGEGRQLDLEVKY